MWRDQKKTHVGAAEPRVLCVMLTRDRPQMARQAVECFNRQTYRNKGLVIWDTGTEIKEIIQPNTWHVGPDESYSGPRTIGQLRNNAIYWASASIAPANIFVNWDDDDWSHPNRLKEQVALLQASGADAVGYNEMLFWRTPSTWECIRHGEAGCETCTDPQLAGEAWLYSNPRPNYALGTSLMYWRKTWEQSPFTDGPKPGGTSEYHHWFGPGSGVRVAAVSAQGVVTITNWGPPVNQRTYGNCGEEPRMIARIHGGNTGQYDLENLIASGSEEWKRVPAWDNRVRDILEGK